jgi:hypothetical protein
MLRKRLYVCSRLGGGRLKTLILKKPIEAVSKAGWFLNSLLEKAVKRPLFLLNLRLLFQNFSFGATSIIESVKTRFLLKQAR